RASGPGGSEAAEVAEASAAEVAAAEVPAAADVAAVAAEAAHAVAAGDAGAEAAHHRAEHRADHQAAEHVDAAVAVVVAAGVGRVRGARVPVGAAGAAGRDHADVRVASVLHGPRVGLAGRDVPRDTARRRPRDVLHRGAVLRVEEAGRAPFGDGFAGQAGAGRGHGVAAVLQGGRDLLHVLRPGGAFSRALGLVIGVHGALVVGADLGVEVRVHDVEVETRDVLAEEGDVLLNTVLELGHLLLGTDALPLPGDEEQA